MLPPGYLTPLLQLCHLRPETDHLREDARPTILLRIVTAGQAWVQ